MDLVKGHQQLHYNLETQISAFQLCLAHEVNVEPLGFPATVMGLNPKLWMVSKGESWETHPKWMI